MKKLEEKIQKTYNNKFRTREKRIVSLINDTKIDISKLNLNEVKILTSSILDIETKKLHAELEMIMSKKEQLERELEKKSAQMQETKYEVFEILETIANSSDEQTISKLYQAKLQSIDLFDLLGETVESAIITALEKSNGSEANETIQELIKDLTYETIKEGTLNTIRVRKILSTILNAAIDIAEATPNLSKDILESILKGMRAGLLHSIDRFKQRLEFIPLEAKHILIEDYDTIMQDLSQTDTLFLQVVQTQANESTPRIRTILIDINKQMHYDLEELVHMSKETALVMKGRFSNLAKDAVKKADSAMQSQTAKEAKRMGVQAWGVAKSAIGSAIKSAKGVIEPKE